MNYKLYGAICVVVGCGGWGFSVAAQYLHRIRMLRQLVCVLDYMECELQYRSTALPLLCRQASSVCSGKISAVFYCLSEELESQISPNVVCCMTAALNKTHGLPRVIVCFLRNLGVTLGKFDLSGQLKGIDSIRQECRQKLDCLQTNHESRIRTYQTLGLCAGAAIAILFI